MTSIYRVGEKLHMNTAYVIREYRPGDEKYVADAHARIYKKEYNWGSAFSNYAGHIAYAYAEIGSTLGEQLWIAEADGKCVGCIMLCRTEEDNVGQLRLFLVEKAYRGQGIGKALTDALIREAKKVGYKKLVLWTAHPLVDAIRCYEHMGFVRTESLSNTDWSLSGGLVYELKYELQEGL